MNRNSQWGRRGEPTLAELLAVMKLARSGGKPERGGGSDGWLCRRAECHYAQKGILNYPDRAACNGCLRRRDAAENPPDYSRLAGKPEGRARGASQGNPKAAEPSGAPTDKQQKKRDARARKRQERDRAKGTTAAASAAPPSATTAAQGPVAPGPVGEAMGKCFATTAAPAPTGKVQLPQELASQLPLLGPAVKALNESLAFEPLPSSTERRSPEAILAKLLGGKDPNAACSKREGRVATISSLKSAIVALAAGGDLCADEIKGLQAKLGTEEAALAKMERNAPSPDAELKTIAEAKAAYELEIQVRKDKASGGAAKTTERKGDREKVVLSLREQLALLEAGLVTVHGECTTKHAQRAAEADEVDKKVLTLLMQRQAAVTSLPGDASSSGGDVAMDTGGQCAALAVFGSGPPVVDYAAMHAEAVAEIERLKAGAAAAMQAALAAQAEFERTVRLGGLPNPELPEAAARPAYGQVHRAIQGWLAAGADAPFDWAPLKTSATAGLPSPLQVIKTMLGKTWHDWYTVEEPADDALVPRHLLIIVDQALSKLTIDYASKQAAEQAASLGAGTLEAITASGKRLRK
jgi:hypothetical protein